jgi:hypothetical protein
MLNTLTNKKLRGIGHAHSEEKSNELKQGIFEVRFTLTVKEGGLTFEN